MHGYMVMVYGLETRKFWEPAWLELITNKRAAEKKLREMRKGVPNRPEVRWAVATIDIPEDGEKSCGS